MGQSARNPELTMAVLVELDRDVPAEGRAADAHVDRDVDRASAQHGDKLALGIRILDMQAAKHALRRAREIVLHEAVGDPALRIALLLERLHEEAARVSEHLGLDDQHARDGGLDDVHRTFGAASLV